MLYIMTSYSCTNPFLVSDTDPLYTNESRNLRIDTMRGAFPLSGEVYAGVTRIDVEIITVRELLRGDTPEANTRRHRVRDGNTALIYVPKALESRDDILAWTLCHLDYPLIHLNVPYNTEGFEPSPNDKLGTPYANLVHVKGPTRHVIYVVPELTTSAFAGYLDIRPGERGFTHDLFGDIVDFLRRKRGYGELAMTMFSLLQRLNSQKPFARADWDAALILSGLMCFRLPTPDTSDGNTVRTRDFRCADTYLLRGTPLLDTRSANKIRGIGTEAAFIGVSRSELSDDYSIPEVHPYARFFIDAGILTYTSAPPWLVNPTELASELYLKAHDIAVIVAEQHDYACNVFSLPLVGWMLDCEHGQQIFGDGSRRDMSDIKRAILRHLSTNVCGVELFGGKMAADELTVTPADMCALLGTLPAGPRGPEDPFYLVVRECMLLPHTRTSRYYLKTLRESDFGYDHPSGVLDWSRVSGIATTGLPRVCATDRPAYGYALVYAPAPDEPITRRETTDPLEDLFHTVRVEGAWRGDVPELAYVRGHAYHTLCQVRFCVTRLTRHHVTLWDYLRVGDSSWVHNE
ncbi:hypothetical protein GNI_219520, partial [Gregarina niphandrodes]